MDRTRSTDTEQITRVANSVELISIHIPKTAGTSFRNTLKEVYGDRNVIRLDIRRTIQVEQQDFNNSKLNERIKVVHGHFRPRDYFERFEPNQGQKLITWLRDPVQRVISNYNYLAGRLAELLDEERKGVDILSKMQRSLLEYAAAPDNRNRMTWYLKGASLEDFAFVGIVEYMEDDLTYLGQLLNWSCLPTFHHNESNKKNSATDSTTPLQIRELNADDVALYEAALKLRERR